MTARGATPVDAALTRLAEAAAQARAGWTGARWEVLTADGWRPVQSEARLIQSRPYCVLPELPLTPGQATVVRAALNVPGRVGGAEATGQPLELTVNSLYPLDARVDGVPLLRDGVPSVALGPALLEVIPAVRAGGAVTLELTVSVPAHQVHAVDPSLIPPWLWMRFTTPASRRRFHALDLAWARLVLCRELTRTDDDEAALAEAAALVPDDLASATEESLGRLAVPLAPFEERVGSLRVHAVAHSHIDLAWLWRWDDTVQVVERDAEAVLALLDEFPELRFTHSQPATYEVLREKRSDLFRRVVAHVEAGRWESATVQWVESDENIVGGEALAQQVAQGVDWSRRHLSQSPRVWLAPDTFGHAGSVPRVAAAAGVDVYYHHRGAPGAPAGWPVYRWEADDGSAVVAVTTPEYFGDITAGEVAIRAIEGGLRHGRAVSVHLFGVCDHGGGPTRQDLDTLRWLRTQALVPNVACSTVAAFADDAASSGPPLPVWRGRSRIVFPGCYTSRGDAKTANRRAESALGTASALAAATGLDIDLSVLWRLALHQQFHDILGGSSIAEVYEDQHAATAAVLKGADAVVARAVAALTEPGDADDVAVLNPHAWPVREAVAVGDDVALVDVAPLAAVPARLRTRHDRNEPVTDDDGDAVILDAGSVCFNINRSTGWVSGCRLGGSPLAGSGAASPLLALSLVVEEPVPMSAWALGKERESELLAATTVEVLAADDRGTVVEARYALRSSEAVVQLTARPGLPWLDVELDVDWRERGDGTTGIPGLKVVVGGLGDIAAGWYEEPYGTAPAPLDGSPFPAGRWVAVENGAGVGVAVLNDGRHGHDAHRRALRVHICRSPYEPDPLADLRRHRVRLRLVPFAAGWRAAGVARAAAQLNQPLVVARGRRPTAKQRSQAPVVDAPDHVMVAGVSPRPGEGVVFRLHDTTGDGGAADVRVPDGWWLADADITGTANGSTHPSPVATLDVPPFGLRTLVAAPGDAPVPGAPAETTRSTGE